jgi:uncharacterized membrane protein
MNPNDKKRLARRLIGTAFTAAGVAHFTHAEFFANLVSASLADTGARSTGRPGCTRSPAA